MKTIKTCKRTRNRRNWKNVDNDIQEICKRLTPVHIQHIIIHQFYDIDAIV